MLLVLLQFTLQINYIYADDSRIYRDLLFISCLNVCSKYESESKGQMWKLWRDSALNHDKKIASIFNNWVHTNSHSHPCDRHAWNKQNPSCAFSCRIKTQTLRGQRELRFIPPPLAHFQGHPFQVEPLVAAGPVQMCLRGSVSSQSEGLAGGLEAWLTNAPLRQADKQTLLGLDGPAIEGRVRVRQYCCSQLTVSLSVSKARLSCKPH